MRTPPTYIDLPDLGAETEGMLKELERLRTDIEYAEARRDELLAVLLAVDIEGYKLVSYRLASDYSGVSAATLQRRYYPWAT